jgi:hypothetical protein
MTGGSANLCVGYGAGSGYTGSEIYNIIFGPAPGTAGQSGAMILGDPNHTGTCFIFGINITSLPSGTPVTISTSGGNIGQLGISTSSRKHKENIEEMENFSDRIYSLRPVIFNFKNDPDKKIQPGLIAEEVLTQFPELVNFNNQGDPETVAYHLIPALLLNELKKQKQIIEDLILAELKKQKQIIEDLNKKISLYLEY